MTIDGLLLRVSQATVVLMAGGWAAVVYTALYLKGGHPPLSAFVGAGVILASWVLGSVGLICGLLSLKQKGFRRNIKILFVCLNAGFLAFSVLVNFM
jgi:hypothetical protein